MKVKYLVLSLFVGLAIVISCLSLNELDLAAPYEQITTYATVIGYVIFMLSLGAIGIILRYRAYIPLLKIPRVRKGIGSFLLKVFPDNTKTKK